MEISLQKVDFFHSKTRHVTMNGNLALLPRITAKAQTRAFFLRVGCVRQYELPDASKHYLLS